MNRIRRYAQAGIAEKNDVLVTIEPRELGAGISIVIKSAAFLEFGRHMTETVKTVLKEQGLDDVRVLVEDKGALDFTLRARCETALRRALQE